MYKIEDITRTYGQAADILNACDSEDIPIYIRLKTLTPDERILVPIDNFEYFKEITGHDPDDVFPLRIFEYDGDVFLGELSVPQK